MGSEERQVNDERERRSGQINNRNPDGTTENKANRWLTRGIGKERMTRITPRKTRGRREWKENSFRCRLGEEGGGGGSIAVFTHLTAPLFLLHNPPDRNRLLFIEWEII